MQNWKTTLIGVMGAIWFAIQPILSNGNFILNRDWKNLVTAGIIAGLGYLAQDYGIKDNHIKDIEPPAKAL